MHLTDYYISILQMCTVGKLSRLHKAQTSYWLNAFFKSTENETSVESDSLVFLFSLVPLYFCVTQQTFSILSVTIITAILIAVWEWILADVVLSKFRF